MKRVLSVIFLITVLFSTLFAIGVNAVEPVHSASDEYLAGEYAAKLAAIELTEDQRVDVMLVALSQLGYHEGNSDADMGGGNTIGNRNFVEYNRIYGKLDNDEGNGESYGYAWCCAFATWCASQAGVSKDIVPIEVSCQRLIQNHFEPMGIYHTRDSGYTPKTADFIFFKSKSSPRISNHVGLVIYSTDTTVYTIEGNSLTDNVSVFSYSLNDAYIVGYASPKYTQKNVATIDFDVSKMGYPVNKYYVTASSLNIRKAPSAESESLGALFFSDIVKINEINGNWGKINYSGIEGWVSLSFLQYAPQACCVLTYDTLGGSLVPSTPINQDGSVTVTETVPTMAGYTFGGWALSKEAAAAEKSVFDGGDETVFPNDTVLYAVWKPNAPVTVSFSASDNVISTQTLKLGQSLNMPEIPDKTSDNSKDYVYEACGWDTDADGTPDLAVGDSFTPENDITITAVYSKKYITYTVQFIGLKGNILSSEQLRFGEMPTAPTNVDGYFSEDGSKEYIFDGWDKEIISVTDNASYNAKAKIVNIVVPTLSSATTAVPTEATTLAPSPTEVEATGTTTVVPTEVGCSSAKVVTTVVIIIVSLAIVAIAAIWFVKMKNTVNEEDEEDTYEEG